MQLFGFALLPTVEEQERIIDFRLRYSDTISGPSLGLKTNLPHMSITQNPYQQNFIASISSHDLDLVSTPLSSTWDTIFHQPVGWIFGGVQNTEEINQLHYVLFSKVKDNIDTSAIEPATDTHLLSPKEQEYHMKYGYRYTKECFLPHITFGRIPNNIQELSEEVVRAFEREFSGRTILFDRLAFYRAGEFGALEEILAIKHLS